MLHRPIHDEVMNRALRMANACHPVVAEQHSNELARYARLSAACDALESFMGCRPSADEDVFSSLAQRRSQIADLLALARNYGLSIAGSLDQLSASMTFDEAWQRAQQAAAGKEPAKKPAAIKPVFSLPAADRILEQKQPRLQAPKNAPATVYN